MLHAQAPSFVAQTTAYEEIMLTTMTMTSPVTYPQAHPTPGLDIVDDRVFVAFHDGTGAFFDLHELYEHAVLSGRLMPVPSRIGIYD